MGSAAYRRIALKSPELANLVGIKSLSIHQGAEIFPSAELSVPPIEFGDVSPMGMYGSQGLYNLALTDELGFWNNAQVAIGATYAFEVADAIVHPPTGIVTVGDHVLDDTIAHAPFHLPGYGLRRITLYSPLPRWESICTVRFMRPAEMRPITFIGCSKSFRNCGSTHLLPA
jgi:hypothetical protein